MTNIYKTCHVDMLDQMPFLSLIIVTDILTAYQRILVTSLQARNAIPYIARPCFDGKINEQSGGCSEEIETMAHTLYILADKLNLSYRNQLNP